MSKRWASACRRKIHYRSERRANDAAKESQRKFKIPMNAYPCPFCRGKWVVGSTYPQYAHEARVTGADNPQNNSLDRADLEV